MFKSLFYRPGHPVLIYLALSLFQGCLPLATITPVSPVSGRGPIARTPQDDEVPLIFNVPQTGSIPPTDQPGICRISEPQYTVEIPDGVARVTIELRGDADVDLYVRGGQRVTREQSGVVADFRSETGGSSERILIPPIGTPPPEGIYFIAVSNCNFTRAAAFTLTATLFRPPDEDTVSLPGEIAEVGSIPAPSSGGCILGQTQYTFRVFAPRPCGAIATFLIRLASNQNVDLYIRFNQRVVVENGNIIADIVSKSTTGVESVLIDPPAQDSTLFIAVANCSNAIANYSVGARLAAIGDPFPPTVVTSCKLKRNSSGTFILELRAFNLTPNSTVSIGGVTPKKVKIKDLARGVMTVQGGVCNGLPGPVKIINPGVGEACTPAFLCNERCPD